ncbi:potassium channel subfamily K member 1-like [Acanthaster planci]|uniref:Potassium channel subfamily K member 1-like n=1 Tax=Acanthaster planci TaxID=133434 RepID=A0A8B7YC40_ACAPL|nr:potassium channel subfamily K member 1-like [Acanthaster planci]XP_022090805.1 potassium channel subfamily K member 1-like [Acanthaster planci]XP_022090806.1 potassium channel subfamily K member 1-like [Acanthaster planci]XP_022090807.1 potassium channel subfamily K member 1-like [Acanthaster planci]XP_022090808.1 potassium channel subfamily K member 1-like [Acanthaster planci]XP_022090809.1 potassium channel subfamily K member 1-like [Acanthaster planci]XP_022090810.1 potassium channel su
MGAGRRVLALLVATFAYLFIGASIFSAIESAHEEQIRLDLYNRLEAFAERNPCVNVSEFRDVLSEVWYAASIGMERMVGQENYTLPSSRWDLANAFFFSATVITTIGYGHLSPATSSGQNFCIAYAYFGIPLMAVLLSEISSKWKQRLINVGHNLDTRLANALKRDRVRRVAIAILLVIPAYVIVIIIPATVFSYIEGWDFLVAHYYCFISLSTIGLGDFVATQHDYENRALIWLYKICTTLYLIAGLGVMAIVFHGVRTKKRKPTQYTFRQKFVNILRKRRKPWLEIMDDQADAIAESFPVEGGVISSAVAAAAVAVTVNTPNSSEPTPPQNDLDSCGLSSDNNDSDNDFDDEDSLDDQCRSQHFPQIHKENNTDDIHHKMRQSGDFLDPASEENSPFTFRSIIANSHTSISADVDSDENEEGPQRRKAFNDIDNPKHSRKSSLPQRLDFRNFGAHRRSNDSTPELNRTQSQSQTQKNHHSDGKTEGGALASNLAKKKLWSPSSSYAGEDSGIHAASSQSTVEMESTV